MEVVAGYKQSEVGVIPTDWQVAELGDCLGAHPEYGINAAAVPYSDQLPTYIRITDISREGRFTPEPRASVSSSMADYYYLLEGDIVFARTGASVGKSYRYDPADGPLVFAGFLIRVRPDPEKLLPTFLEAYVNTTAYWRWVRQTSMRSGQPGINGSEYAKLRVPLPSVKEQRAIATALSDLDALLDGLDRLIAKKRDLKQAAMQQLLTGRTRLPGFSGEWEVRRLGGHVRFLKNGSHSRAQLTGDGSLKNLHYGDIHTSTRVVLDPRVTAMPSLPLNCGASLDRLQDGDLVFVDASEDLDGVGKSVELMGVSGVEVVAGLHTIAARFDKSVLADGFKGYLQFVPEFRSHLTRLAAGTKVYATSRAHIASAEIRLPGASEQFAIAAVLSDMDAEIGALEARRDKTRDLKQAMMQELLTGRTRLVQPAAGERAVS